jgi:hypothetical protein
MLLIAGMGSLGALLGILFAWSASPVVMTAVPLIIQARRRRRRIFDIENGPHQTE